MRFSSYILTALLASSGAFAVPVPEASSATTAPVSVSASASASASASVSSAVSSKPSSASASASASASSSGSSTSSAAAPKATLNGNEVITGSLLTNGTVQAFRGIPFAEPPVGKLRFRAPVPFNGSYNNLDATQFGGTCMSSYPNPSTNTTSNSTTTTTTSSSLPIEVVDGPAVPEEIQVASAKLNQLYNQTEDCLFLNVYRPSNVPEGTKLPVMAWIYGGGFVAGSSSSFPGENIVANSIALNQPVIYVSLNYRVSVWGFLGGSEMAANNATNNGILDQRLALEWISDNIESFGGDPENVTIFGESAGSMSVAIHMYLNNGNNTYKDKPLFNKAIMQSGAILPYANISSNVPQSAYDGLVKALDCGNDTSEFECIQKGDNDVFQNFTSSLSGLEGLLAFAPRTDNRILFDPYEAFDAGNFTKIPYIAGNQEDEGTGFIIGAINSLDVVLESDSPSAIGLMLDIFFPNVSTTVVNEVSQLYPMDPKVGSPYRTSDLNVLNPQFKRISSLFGDFLFQGPRRYMISHTPSDIPVYTFQGSTSYGTAYYGTDHASDIVWQYGLNYGPSLYYNNYFISFAVNGDPNKGSNGLNYWPPHSAVSNTSVRFNLAEVTYIEDDYRATSIAALTNPELKA